MKFKSEKFYSKTLGKEIELETYKDENETIISTKSLQSFFSSIRAERKIRETIDSYNPFFNQNGEITYAYVALRLEDSLGYQACHVGEIILSKEKRNITKSFPLTMALNRAESAAIIAYLQLPGKVYSDAQFIDTDKKEMETNSVTNAESENKEVPLTEKYIKPIERVTKESKPIEDEKVSENISTSSTIKSAPMLDETEVDENLNVSDTSEEAGTKTEMNTVPFNQNIEEEIESSEEKEVKDENSINKNTTFTIGEFHNISINEVLDMYRNNESRMRHVLSSKYKMMDAMNEGKKKDIFRFLKNETDKINEELNISYDSKPNIKD